MQTPKSITIISLSHKVQGLLEQTMLIDGVSKHTSKTVVSGWERLGYNLSNPDYLVEHRTHIVNL